MVALRLPIASPQSPFQRLVLQEWGETRELRGEQGEGERRF